MLRPELFFSDDQGTLIKGFGLLVLPLVLVEACQVIESGGGVGVLRTLGLLPDGQGTLKKRVGLLILALKLVEPCQGTQGILCVGLFGYHALVPAWVRT